MNQETKEATSFVVLLVIIIVIFMGILYPVIAWTDYDNAKRDCEKFTEYGYLTQFEGGFFGGWDCFIIMQDGTKVNSYDFNIADYKKPVKIR